jgi:LysR family transcriptional regulator, glycine cleavage system transcriptional activator
VWRKCDLRWWVNRKIYMRELNRFHLNGLKAVESVGRLGNLALAADELGVSVGAISQHIIRTERALGRPLFVRDAKGMVPADTSKLFLSKLGGGFRELVAALDTIEDRTQNRLTISVAPVFASKWLVPRLGRFQERCPDLQILIDATTTVVDLEATDIDLAIRVGKGPWQGVNAERLVDQRIFPVCSPTVGERLKRPRDLPNVPVIRDRNSSLSWSLWLKKYSIAESDLADGPVYSDAALCMDAAIAGQGVMLAWQTLANDALSEGRLVRPFRHVIASGLTYWLVTPSHRRPEYKSRRFGAWLKEELEASVTNINRD